MSHPLDAHAFPPRGFCQTAAVQTVADQKSLLFIREEKQIVQQQSCPKCIKGVVRRRMRSLISLDSTATECWDNPISANPNRSGIKSDIESRLNRYKNSEGFTAVWIIVDNYMQEIPSMFVYNAICVMSDQLTSKAGTITSGEDRFMEWKTKDGDYENTQYAQFDTFFEGMFQKARLLDIIKNFICFSNEGINSFKILAGYHQYFAVRKAIESTKHATVTDGKGGVFWHTQGSGKSLSMVFYAHLLQEALDSPTIVVITDRNDLDDQLYGQFAKCKDFLRQEPVHATCRKLTETSGKNDVGLKDWLDGRQANGIIFTTMQKFEESHEALSERHNIVVMADEAHRGQYGLTETVDAKTGKVKIGTARVIRNTLPTPNWLTSL